jgi:hypothetical protein
MREVFKFGTEPGMAVRRVTVETLGKHVLVEVNPGMNDNRRQSGRR